jgi:uncharacterized Tic20 family protein
MSPNDDLRQLEEDHRMGVLSDDEFARRKAAITEARFEDSPPAGPSTSMSPEARQWAMFIHLSQLTSAVVPGAGLILPIVLWQMKKNELPGIDEHGKMVTNFIISLLIYTVVCVVTIVGWVLLPVIVVISLVFPIIGGIKANNGEFWKYPLTIRFIK